MRKPILGASLALLFSSAVLGFLNSAKIKILRAENANAVAAQNTVEDAHVAARKQIRGREKKAAAASSQLAPKEVRTAVVETELVRAETEKASLKSQLTAREAELMQLKNRGQSPAVSALGSAADPKVTELQAQLEQTRQQLDSAEREKTLLADRIHSCEESAKPMTQERQPRRRPSPPPGLHGDVLAVNQAYNFVVLNLGAGQGVEANSEMLVLRGRTVIGKIRVSSVEPATSIGDIIGSSLPRGVQVQTGDTVIYAGSGF